MREINISCQLLLPLQKHPYRPCLHKHWDPDNAGLAFLFVIQNEQEMWLKID